MLDDGVLSADAAGLAKMADGFLADSAGGRAKMADGFLSADAGGRAKMDDGFVTVDELADSIDASGAKGFNADKVDGYDAADLLAGGVIGGAIIMWFGTLGGSDGHRPVVGGTPNEDWHVCNGDLVGAVQTPNMQGRVPVGVGGTLAAAKGDVGGNVSINFSHWHPDGTLATAVHTHGVTPEFYPDGAGSHLGIAGVASGAAIDVTGNTGSALSTINVMNPYLALYFLMKVA
jgi:hypothetical protein